MKTKWLFPHSIKIYGWILSIIFLGLGTGMLFFELQFPFQSPFPTKDFFGEKTLTNNLTNEIIGIGLTIGLMLLAFSKSKIEDEFTAQLRLDCLQWSVYAHYFLLAVSMIFIYGEIFLYFMNINMFLLLIIFNVRFHILLYRHIRSTQSDS
jgi:hypothetical protein